MCQSVCGGLLEKTIAATEMRGTTFRLIKRTKKHTGGEKMGLQDGVIGIRCSCLLQHFGMEKIPF